MFKRHASPSTPPSRKPPRIAILSRGGQDSIAHINHRAYSKAHEIDYYHLDSRLQNKAAQSDMDRHSTRIDSRTKCQAVYEILLTLLRAQSLRRPLYDYIIVIEGHSFFSNFQQNLEDLVGMLHPDVAFALTPQPPDADGHAEARLDTSIIIVQNKRGSQRLIEDVLDATPERIESLAPCASSEESQRQTLHDHVLLTFLASPKMQRYREILAWQSLNARPWHCEPGQSIGQFRMIHFPQAAKSDVQTFAEQHHSNDDLAPHVWIDHLTAPTFADRLANMNQWMAGLAARFGLASG